MLLRIFIVSLTSFTFLHSAYAARVTKTSGKQVLIENEDTDVREGDRYYAIIDGKKRGIIQITKVAKGKSRGTVTKGRAAVDASLELVASKSDGDMPLPRRKGKSSTAGAGPSSLLGVMVGYSMDSQSVKTESGSTVAMSGSGYSLKGFYDMPLSGSLGLIARSGAEQLNWASGASTTSIMYLTLDALLRYSFGEDGFVPFVAGGLGLHYPLTKSSNILIESRISTTTVFFFDAGFYMPMGESMLLTAVAEYGMFPPSNDVSTSFMELRVGAGWRY